MRTGLLIVGSLLILIGGVWMGQGANLIGGSFMTGQSLWLEIGLGVAVVGMVLVGATRVWWSSIGRRH